MEEKAGRHAVEADNDPMLKTAVHFINASLTWIITRVIGLDSSMFRSLVSLCDSNLHIPQLAMYRTRAAFGGLHRPSTKAVQGTGVAMSRLIGLFRPAHALAAGRGGCLGCQEAGCRGEAGLRLHAYRGGDRHPVKL